MKILGTNFFGHDSSICYINTAEKKIFAISTERLTRIKHDPHDVSPIIDKIYENKNFDLRDVDLIAQGYEDYSWVKPYYYDYLKTKRKILNPKYLSDIINLKKKEKYKKYLRALITNPKILFSLCYYKFLSNCHKFKKKFIIKSKFIEKNSKNFIKNTLERSGIKKKINYYNHHKCHAASAYYFSQFAFNDDSLSLTIDGYGDNVFSSLYFCSNKKIELISESKAEKIYINNKINHTSIGYLYSAFTSALGFIPNSDEGKVEALAAFGKNNEKLTAELSELVDIKNNSINLHKEKIIKFYDTNYLKKIIGKIGRENFAYCIQNWLEKTIINYLNIISKNYDCKNLCLSGGVAANVIMNMKIYEKTNFNNIYIFPAMGDEGVAVGAALLSALENNQDITWLKHMIMPYYGTDITEKSIIEDLSKFNNIEFIKINNDLHKRAAESLSKNKIIALVQGKMEFGPRALGNRSILASPLNKETKDRINLEIKRRPAFQPFCPSIIDEDREKIFSKSYNNKHMTIAFKMKDEFAKKFPSAVHIDNTARPQFVSRDDNSKFYNILKEFKRLTGYGILINTSFNLHGRSMVRTPFDAITDFIDCNLDELYLGDYLVTKKRNYRN